jgi:hypothetical protein
LVATTDYDHLSEMYIYEFEKSMEKKFPKIPGTGNMF